MTTGLAILAALVSTTPAMRAEPWWRAAFEAKKEYVSTNLDARVAFVGDSITARWGMKEGRAVWDATFAAGRRKAANFGISGDRTEHVAWRLLNGQFGAWTPEVVVLEIGTNNNGHRPAAEETPIDTIRGVRRLVEILRCHWPEAKVVLHPIFPRGERPNDPVRVRNERVNVETRRLADGVRVFWCDFNAKLLEQDGTLSRDVMGDFLHPTEKGMRLWAENLLPVLDYALGDTSVRPAGCGPAPQESSRRAWEPAVSGWLDFRVAPKRGEIEAKASRHFDAVFLGDSITHLWEERAVDVQREFLGGFEILNLGFSGERTQGILWDCENGLLDGYRADFVSIMIGTNNRRDSAADVAKGIEAIVKSVRAHQPGARVLLFNLFPRGERPDDPDRAKVAAVNRLIRDLDDGDRVEYVELWDEFLEPDGSISKSVMSDFLHPTPEGYSIWARKLAALMEGGADRPRADPAVEYARSEFERYARRLTGRGLPRGLASLSVDASLGEQTFRLKETDGRLSITGGDGAGLLYGVYEYLERHCGIRWYAKDCERVPRRRKMPVPIGLDDVQRPAFRMRTAEWYDAAHDADFAARLRLNGEGITVRPRHGGAKYRFGRGLGSCHTMNSLVDPETLFAAHPEYFAEWEGRRDWDEHCFTHPDVFKLTLEGVLARMRADPSARWYGVSQNDTDKHCQCAKCTAVNAEEESPAGTIVRFVNAIAEAVEKEFPDAVVETLAYRYSAKPPKKTRLRRNVMPCFCTFECEFANPLSESPLPANRAIAGDIAGWKAAMSPGSDVYVWDYTTCFPNYLMPFPNVRTLRENCRFFRDNGVTCLFEQGGCQGRHAEFAELKTWLLSKWLWNPDAPYEELVDDFMNGYYGKAAPFVRRYFDKVQALAKTFDPLKNPLRINIDPRVEVDPRTAGLTDAFLEEGEAIFKDALEAVRDDPADWWRVRRTALTVDYCLARRDGPGRKSHIRELRKAMARVEAEGAGVIRLSNGAGALKDRRIQEEFDRVLSAPDVNDEKRR